ncbi:hypothetical protein EVB27_089 [Rhizobium phage RHph_TM16]|nr:hypothetical protein EVB27_089 [Rhizobium phage RHph_TM16]
MAETILKILVRTELPLTEHQRKQLRWHLSDQLKAMEYDEHKSPRGNVIQGAFVMGDDE